MAFVSKIDRLPITERRAVVKAITEAMTGSNEPNYRALCARLSKELPEFGKMNLSHTALFRFAKNTVQPQIRDVLKSCPTNDNARTREVSQQDVKAVQGATERALDADPIRSALDAQRDRLLEVVHATKDSGQFETYARIENVLGQNIERTAKAIMHPGFSQQAQPGTVNQIVVMLPRQGDVQRRIEGTGVVDAELIEPPGS